MQLLDSIAVRSAFASLLYLLRAWAYTERPLQSGPFARAHSWLRTAEMTFHFASRFSLFSNMSTERFEVILEASDDGVCNL